MAPSPALCRLLRIRNLEEEQSRLALESAMGELARLQDALKATVERERHGRRLIEASACTGELPDRLAGIEEAHTADRLFAALGPRIAIKEDEVLARRQEFLLKRVERRQAETLIEAAEAQGAIEAGRRGQQALDNWYGSRKFRIQTGAESAAVTTGEFEIQTDGGFETPDGQGSWFPDET